MAEGGWGCERFDRISQINSAPIASQSSDIRLSPSAIASPPSCVKQYADVPCHRPVIPEVGRHVRVAFDTLHAFSGGSPAHASRITLPARRCRCTAGGPGPDYVAEGILRVQ